VVSEDSLGIFGGIDPVLEASSLEAWEETAADRGRTVIVSSMASDSHTWNLVYLQLLVEELGFDVVNLGACTPDELIVSECRGRRPAMLVLSSVNGHGYRDGLRVIRALREHPELAELPVVIGGKLGISGGESEAHIHQLVDAGFDAVFDEHQDAPDSFRRFIAAVPERSPDRLLAARHKGAGA
jgi:methylaspartate mutase sigma subunit